MMELHPDLEIPVDTSVPPHVQELLYTFVRTVDREYNFPHGLTIYYHLLSALNQYFKKLP